MLSKDSFGLSCAAMDLAEWHCPVFAFFVPPLEGEELKEWIQRAETFLRNALRCREVREERKERPLFLSSREITGRKTEKSRFWFRRLSGEKT